MKRSSDEQIPPKWLVRAVAFPLLLVGIFLMYLAIVNFAMLGTWFGIGVFLSGFGLVAAAMASLYTGNPEWILLNLILPG